MFLLDCDHKHMPNIPHHRILTQSHHITQSISSKYHDYGVVFVWCVISTQIQYEIDFHFIKWLNDEVWIAVLDMWEKRHVFWMGLWMMTFISESHTMRNEEGKGDDGFDESVSLNKSNNELNELYVFVWLMYATQNGWLSDCFFIFAFPLLNSHFSICFLFFKTVFFFFLSLFLYFPSHNVTWTTTRRLRDLQHS